MIGFECVTSESNFVFVRSIIFGIIFEMLMWELEMSYGVLVLLMN